MAGKNDKTVEILDCTIRDGGYFNDWDFDPKLVKELYRNLSRAGVDIIELGYRNTVKAGKGIWYSSPEALLNELFADSPGARMALMVDCANAAMDTIPNAKDSLVAMYRVACQKDQVLAALALCEELQAKGYMTSLQLMGIVGFTPDDFARLLGPLKEAALDYLYFADSYGSMLPKDIPGYIQRLRPAGKRLGFHAHNGLQLAFANTLEAMRGGVDIVDGTVYGMGRGAGNLPLEVLITYLEKTLSHEQYNSIPVLDLIDRYFVAMHKKLGWGYCLPYMLSGIFEVHPNYAKHMIDAQEYEMEDMVRVLETVKSLRPVGFSRKLVEDVIQRGFAAPADSAEDDYDDVEIAQLRSRCPVSYQDRHRGQDFLILANGPSLKQYHKDIKDFIGRYRPVVMGANFLGGLFVPQYHAFSNKKRFMHYAETVHDDSRLLLSSSFDEEFIRSYTDKEFELIAHLNRVSSVFDIKAGVITSNCRTVSILLIAVAIAMGAKRIFVAGMDGYKIHEALGAGGTHFYEESQEAESLRMLVEKHNWNETLLDSINAYLLANGKEGLHIITPTSHKKYYSHIQNWGRGSSAIAGKE